MRMDRAVEISEAIELILDTARIPGAAVAMVSIDGSAWTRGFGYRDLDNRLPVTSDTVYPIASTTKAMNATLIGMLIDEGYLGWDVPVREYIPAFQLADPFTSAQVTVRDFLTMRTGLPRHDWVWVENNITRAELTRRLRYLEMSSGFRERFQYNNITATIAGHIAEVVTGRTWEELLRERILEPLAMTSTGFSLPQSEDITLSYGETRTRDLKLIPRFAGEVTAPSGGAVHSTIKDMSKWVSFNLSGGTVQDHRLIRRDTLTEIQSPQVPARPDPSCPSPCATYAMGWFVDTYGGYHRLSHGGVLHGLNSSVMLFPEQGVGLVSFVNFSATRLAPILNQTVFDILMGSKPQASLDSILRRYEEQVQKNKERNASAVRVESTLPSHDLGDYCGTYEHAGYGSISIVSQDDALLLKRGNFALPLEHWHYDAWVGKDSDLFELHLPNAFDRCSPMLFETSGAGEIVAATLRLEPAAAPIRFVKKQ